MAKKERRVLGPVELTDMAYGGEAVGRHEGMVLFLNGGAPGDVVNAEVTISKKSFARGSVVEVLQPSPLRTEAPCPYFHRGCGGCQWQHVRYEEQLAIKRHLVQEAFERIGHLEVEVRPVLGMDHPWHYRNTMEFGFTFEAEPGLRRTRGHRIVAVAECLISRAEINETLELLWDLFARERLAEVLPHNAFIRAGDVSPGVVVGLFGHGEWGEIGDRLAGARPDLIAGIVQRKGRGSEKGRTLFGKDYTEHVLLGKEYRASVASFFQVNRAQMERLIQQALAWLEPTSDQVILDAYSGVGTFSLQLAEKVMEIIAVESGPSANADARINASRWENIRLVEGNFGEAPLPVERVDGVVIDPPRAGCSPEAVEALVRLSPARIVYVSCDPTTLARDAALLVAAGYRLDEVQPVDMFPQTYHVETVAAFSR